MDQSDVKCGICQKMITAAELKEEIRTKSTTIIVDEGKLYHRICFEHPLSKVSG